MPRRQRVDVGGTNGVARAGCGAASALVGEFDDAGQRPITINSRLERDTDEQGSLEDEEWTLHASGVLTAGSPGRGEQLTTSGQGAMLAGEWPPADAEPVEIDELYDDLAVVGLEYGPVFQGLRAVWRRGEDVFAEVALSEAEMDQAGSFGLHPALLDAVLHAIGISLEYGKEEQDRGVRLPFLWREAELYAAGASSLRVCLSRVATDTVSLLVADGNGEPVASGRRIGGAGRLRG